MHIGSSPPLSNLNQEDLSITDWRIDPKPRHVYTDSSFEYAKYRICQACVPLHLIFGRSCANSGLAQISRGLREARLQPVDLLLRHGARARPQLPLRLARMRRGAFDCRPSSHDARGRLLGPQHLRRRLALAARAPAPPVHGQARLLAQVLPRERREGDSSALPHQQGHQERASDLSLRVRTMADIPSCRPGSFTCIAWPLRSASLSTSSSACARLRPSICADSSRAAERSTKGYRRRRLSRRRRSSSSPSKSSASTTRSARLPCATSSVPARRFSAVSSWRRRSGG